MSKLIILLSLLSLQLYAFTQDSLSVAPRYDLLGELQHPGANGGKANIHTDPLIHNLLKWHIHTNEMHKSFSGYRIQIHSVSSFGCNIEQLKSMRDNFEKTFPDMPAYLKYFDPDFKIRVGNFRSRLECIPALHRIKKMYPASYPVKTDITLDELVRIPMQDTTIPEEDTKNE